VVDGTRCKNNTEYLLCKSDIKKDLVTATAAISALGTFCMGLFSNMYAKELPKGWRERET
jgi:AGZA family xanthine/uracil permease-like MFS transporter